MTIFKDRYVCCILTCNKPYYKSRLEKNKDIIHYLQNIHNFVIVYVYGNATEKTELHTINTNEYSLYLCVPETYMHLSQKMQLAYSFFQHSDCKGILKIDDDTQILNTQLFEEIIMPQFQEIDYVGIQSSEYSYIDSKLIGTNSNLNVKLHNTQVPNTSHTSFKNLYCIIKEPFTYMAGPFYWISNTALQTLCNLEFEYIEEDASVGYCISKNKELSVQSNDMLKHICISWGMETEN